MTRLQSRLAGAVFGCTLMLGGGAAAARDQCPYLPDYKALRADLPTRDAPRAAAAIERYAATHENPEGCEMADIDRRLAVLERVQYQLHDGRRGLPAQAVFRCNEFDPRSARCAGPMEDGSAQFGLRAAATAPPGPLTPTSSRRGARLVGLFSSTPADLLDGSPPTVLPLTQPITLPAGAKGTRVLMAVYATDGPWRFRKAVWAY